MTWRAWHIFLMDRVIADRFLTEIIAPEVAALHDAGRISNWFFIRYWENGPHLRLRLEGIDDADFAALGGRLREAARAAVAGAAEVAGQYHASMRFDGWHADPSALPWFEQGAVHEILYEPEYRRYGGTQGLAVAEAMFNLSSKFALKVVAATGDAWAKREALALRFTAATIMAVARDEDDILQFLQRMAARGWGSRPTPRLRRRPRAPIMTSRRTGCGRCMDACAGSRSTPATGRPSSSPMRAASRSVCAA